MVIPNYTTIAGCKIFCSLTLKSATFNGACWGGAKQCATNTFRDILDILLTGFVLYLFHVQRIEVLNEQSIVINSGLLEESNTILDNIAEYKALADVYFSPEAVKSRKQRPTNVVAGEVRVICNKSRELKSGILHYLQQKKL